MSSATTVYKGIVHGKTIELDHEPGLPDGQQVTVTVHSASKEGQTMSPGEGLRRALGAWAEDADELDAFLDLNRRQRKLMREELHP